ncbi:MAG: alanine racemase [Stellaceae bacterium]
MARPDIILEIDLDAIAANWRRLRSRLKPGAKAAAVVKADAYGLGVTKVAPRLWRAGCRLFFVADRAEGAALRRVVPEARIAVLNGFLPEDAPTFRRAGLIPTLSDLGQIAAWRRLCAGRPAMIQLDTGMSRLGLPEIESARLVREPDILNGISIAAFISHLACAGDPASIMNQRQLDAFRDLIKSLPSAPASLASGSGIFLGPAYHFDFVRPGAALYGVNPRPGEPNVMKQAIYLKAKIIQVCEIGKDRTVGYDATHRMRRRGRIATLAIGYADGWLRSASDRASVGIGGRRAPVIGRISMDLLTIDVTAVDPALVHPGAYADLLDEHYGVDEFARDAGTIGYEVLTQMTGRHHRLYRGAA